MSLTEPPRTRRQPLWVLFLIAIVPAAVVAGTLYYLWHTRPVQQGIALNHQLELNTSGLSRPTVNKLDARFTDADNDMVADVPTDPKQIVDPPKLIFTYIATPVDDDNPQPDKYKDAFKEFVEYLSKQTGKPVEYRSYTALNDQAKAMRDGELHICAFNTGAVPMAVDLCGFVPVCKLASDDGRASYRMQIIVPADSAITTVQQLKGHELTLTEPTSNSGYKAPLVLLRNEYNMDPERDYTIRYSGGHDESIDGVAAKRFEAAAVAGDILRRHIAKGQLNGTQFRSIYESEVFPTASLGYVYNLNPDLAKKIHEAFFSFDWTNTGLAKEFSEADQTKFVPANFKDDWSLVRKIDDEIGNEYKIN